MMQNYYKNDSGLAAVEFALIVPIVSFLLVAIIDYGLFINHKMKLETVARSVAEYLLVSQDETTVMENIITPYYNSLDDSSWQTGFSSETELVCECYAGVIVECTLGVCEDEGDYKRRFYNVSLSKTHDTLFNYPGLPQSIDLEGTARMQLD